MLLEKGCIISGDAGHNCYPDSGYIGIRAEEQCTANIWRLIMQKLCYLNYEVIDCTPWNEKFNSVQGSLGYRVKVSNNNNSKFHLSIHLNCGGGNGCEAWILNDSKDSEEIANKILSNLKAIGYENRGIKKGNLYINRYTNMPSVILKCGFVDSKYDMRIFDEEKIANSIIEALVGEKVNEKVSFNEDVLINTNNKVNNEYNPNAKVINHWLYVRDIRGDIVSENRIDINTNIQVLKKISKVGVLKVLYPTIRGIRLGYVSDGPWILYY